MLCLLDYWQAKKAVLYCYCFGKFIIKLLSYPLLPRFPEHCWAIATALGS